MGAARIETPSNCQLAYLDGHGGESDVLRRDFNSKPRDGCGRRRRCEAAGNFTAGQRKIAYAFLLPMYDIQADEGVSFPASWRDVAKEPADFGTLLRYRVGAGKPNWKELVMDIVREEHEELVKAVVAARGDDEDDNDGDGDGNADAENAEGTPDDPLPGVNLSGIPVMFRADIAAC